MEVKGIRIVPELKVSHDDWRSGETFDYDDMVARGIPAVGIPAMPNNLIIIDVDVASEGGHTFDGTKFWSDFASENSLPETYTVQTPSGGMHFYYRLPEELNKTKFKPRKQLARGVDIVYNGYVQAPPTAGYRVINGHIRNITEAPVTLLGAVVNKLAAVGEESDDLFAGIHKPLTDSDISKLRKNLEWMQMNGQLTYQEWFSGLVSLRAGVQDQDTLEELALMWTQNGSYREGDDAKAMHIIDSASPVGGIGPGTIFGIIKDKMLEQNSNVVPTEMLTQRDVIERSGVQVVIDPKTGMPKVPPTETNIVHIINAIPEFAPSKLYFDTRMDSYMFNNQQVDDQIIVNRCTTLLQSTVDGLGFANFSRRTIDSAVKLLMEGRKRDPHLEWLKSLRWDGVSRIEKFFPAYAGVVDNLYTRAVGKNLWISLAARGLRPGCKMDNVVILEGAEGVRKSTLVEAIGGRYYLSLSTDEKLNNIETLRKMHQSAVVEIPELVSLISRNAEATKAILTTKVDRVRDLFAKKAYDRPRGFVMIGTTNEDQYLTPEMGQRRYWPIKIPSHVQSIDIEAILSDRDQLFAEAVHRYNKGETYWVMPKTGWDKEVYRRQIVDPLADSILEMLMNAHSTGEGATLDDIFQFLKMRDLMSSGLDTKKGNRIKTILHQLGTECPIEAGPNGLRRRVYKLKPSAVADALI